LEKRRAAKPRDLETRKRGELESKIQGQAAKPLSETWRKKTRLRLSGHARGPCHLKVSPLHVSKSSINTGSKDEALRSGADSVINNSQACPVDSLAPHARLGLRPADGSLSQQSPPASAPSLVKRKRWVRRRRKLDVPNVHLGMAWILGWLICKRYELSLAVVAADAHVGEQTLREYLRLLHPDAWTTGSLVALEVGYLPDELEALTRRWMRKFRCRMKRLHLGERDYVLHYPWEPDPNQEEQDSGQP